MHRWVKALLALQIVLGVLAWSDRARAYAWMIRHDYTGCTQCHADPSGGGLLTLYGRVQSETLLRSYFTKHDEDEEPGKTGDFLFGALPLPESVLLGGDYRVMAMSSAVGGAPATTRLIQMQADLEGQVTLGWFRANGSAGYDRLGAQAAWVTNRPTGDNLVSRVHWLGADLGDDKQFLVRAGRMNLPFGIRSIEHTLFTRTPVAIPGGGVRDDTNSGQQDGVSLAYNGSSIRGEILAILGNYQISPDEFRERGYSGYLEWAPSPSVALGASSLVTIAQRDPFLRTALIRHAHGIFARAVPWKPLALLAEEDLLLDSQPLDQTPAGQAAVHLGQAGMLQADLEPWQGLHLMVTGEMTNPPVANASLSYGVWGSVAWFFLPHVDVRFDAIQQSLAVGPTPLAATTFLAQFHAFL